MATNMSSLDVKDKKARWEADRLAREASEQNRSLPGNHETKRSNERGIQSTIEGHAKSNDGYDPAAPGLSLGGTSTSNLGSQQRLPLVKPAQSTSTSHDASVPGTPFEKIVHFFKSFADSMGWGKGQKQVQNQDQSTAHSSASVPPSPSTSSASDGPGFVEILGMLFSAFMQLKDKFDTFMNSAEQEYKKNNPGRPLEASEIKPEDKLFAKYIGNIAKPFRVALTQRWRAANNATKESSEKDKAIILGDLKNALLEAGNMEALDNLRFDTFMSKINDAARNRVRRVKQDKGQAAAWEELETKLTHEGCYVEADEILQEKTVKQIQKMAENPETYGSDILMAYQEAFEKLNARAATLGAQEINEQIVHYQERKNLLKAISAFEKGMSVPNKALAEDQKRLKDSVGHIQKQYETQMDTVQQYQSALDLMPQTNDESIAVRAQQQEMINFTKTQIEANYQSVKKVNEEKMRQLDKKINAEKRAKKATLIEWLKLGDLNKPPREFSFDDIDVHDKTADERRRQQQHGPQSAPVLLSRGAQATVPVGSSTSPNIGTRDSDISNAVVEPSPSANNRQPS